MLPREFEDRGLELGLLLREFLFFLSLRVEVLLELREALGSSLRPGLQFFQLELRIVQLELVRLQNIFELHDLVPKSVEGLRRTVPLKDEGLRLLLGLVHPRGQGEDLLLSLEDSRVRFRGGIV